MLVTENPLFPDAGHPTPICTTPELMGFVETKEELHERIYQLYALFACDAEKTAVAAKIPLEVVEEMAKNGRWDAQFQTLIKLRQSGRPGDLERATNRAINFVQAHNYRRFLERIMRMLSLLTPKELEEYCFEIRIDKQGNESRKMACRPFADLATAIEKCHAMTYAALTDTASDRQHRKEGHEEGEQVVDAHVQIAGALQRMHRESNPKQSDKDSGDSVTT